MPLPPTELARRLKALREQKGIQTQEDAAALVGVDVRSWNRWETGAGTISLAKALQVAETFDIDHRYLIGEHPIEQSTLERIEEQGSLLVAHTTLILEHLGIEPPEV